MIFSISISEIMRKRKATVLLSTGKTVALSYEKVVSGILPAFLPDYVVRETIF